MPKRNVEDVLPPRRSVRNIPLSEEKISKTTSRPRTRPATPQKDDVLPPTPQPVLKDAFLEEGATAVPPSNRRRKRRTFVWTVSALIVVVALYVASSALVKASVQIVPTESVVTISSDLTAGSDASETEDSDLNYDLITVSAEVSKNVKVTGEEQVEKKASGNITIFNNHSGASQTLVKNTRFESSTGLIYRIQSAVTVPGRKSQGGTTVPGSVTVPVFADKAGAEYNIGLSDFTIPGFKGDPRYQTITAKSDPKAPLQGGFVGKVKKIQPSDLQAAQASMEVELRDVLNTRILAEVPANYVFFKDGAIITFQDMLNGGESSDSNNQTPETTTVRKKATITGVLFDKEKLTARIAESAPQQDGTYKAFTIKDWGTIKFSFKNNSEANISSREPIQFSMNGQATLVAQVNKEEVASVLAGKKKSQLHELLSSLSYVEKAELKTYPAWARSLPKDIKKINIEVIQP